MTTNERTARAKMRTYANSFPVDRKSAMRSYLTVRAYEPVASFLKSQKPQPFDIKNLCQAIAQTGLPFDIERSSSPDGNYTITLRPHEFVDLIVFVRPRAQNASLYFFCFPKTIDLTSSSLSLIPLLLEAIPSLMAPYIPEAEQYLAHVETQAFAKAKQDKIIEIRLAAANAYLERRTAGTPILFNVRLFRNSLRATLFTYSGPHRKKISQKIILENDDFRTTIDAALSLLTPNP